MNVHGHAAALGVIALLALCSTAAADPPQESRPLPAHHDLENQPNRDIYRLTRVAHEIPRIHPSTLPEVRRLPADFAESW